MPFMKLTDSNQLIAGATLLVKGNCCKEPHRFKLTSFRSTPMLTYNHDGSPTDRLETGWYIKPRVHGCDQVSDPNLKKGIQLGRVQAVVR